MRVDKDIRSILAYWKFLESRCRGVEEFRQPTVAKADSPRNVAQLASRNTRSSGAICPQRPTQPPRSTACVFLRPTRLSPSHGSGTSLVSSARSRRPTVRSSPSTRCKVKNFGIWIRYDSRSGTHNMYKEYREMSRVAAVDALYQDMAARHRSRFRSSRLLRLRRPTMSADHTSSSSSSRTSSSPSPTASTRRPARRSSPPPGHPLSSKRVSHYGVRSGWAGTIWVSLGYACFTKRSTLGTNEIP
ncbi:hypothetical protein IAQ61_000887 [Plenodomus lingam]|uniref:uncharacterized protein n=1 Tax=Leptosphaeria maculans TaxID=5022 RepID=UPI003319F615|nr:hypothetical protein IAQ61_000887 [Plenodomus lingam]